MKSPTSDMLAEASGSPVTTKECRKCREIKPTDSFNVDRGKKDGVGSYCRECKTASARDRRRANPELSAQRSKQWRNAHPQRSAEVRARSLRRHPEKRRARQLLNAALRRGEVAKPTSCEECGKEVADAGLLHAHHNDYQMPLEVQWLCSRCHGITHAQDGAK